jgi:endo-1,4-beta-mannosidase
MSNVLSQTLNTSSSDGFSLTTTTLCVPLGQNNSTSFSHQLLNIIETIDANTISSSGENLSKHSGEDHAI